MFTSIDENKDGKSHNLIIVNLHFQLITIDFYRKTVHERDRGGFQEDGHRHHGGRGGEAEEQVGKVKWSTGAVPIQ